MIRRAMLWSSRRSTTWISFSPCDPQSCDPQVAKKPTNENTLTGRVKRYAQVGTAIGGFAARVAGERVLGIKGDRAKNAEGLKLALGGLKGPLMKVAQILSTIPEALPPEYAAEL